MSEIVSDSPLDGVVAAAKQAPGRGLPPVHLWNPSHSGEIDIVIRSDGRWVHEGAIIHREGLVRLFSTVLRKDPDGYWLVTPVEKMKITVEDDGEGMPPEEIARCLEPFSQAEMSLSRHHQGLGMGLPIAGGILALHGGGLEAESIPGSGLRVSLRLPRAG